MVDTPRPGYMIDGVETVAADSVLLMRLHRCEGLARSEISVIDSKTGAPIPFTWHDHSTLAVDGAFAEVAAVRITPKRLRDR